MRRFFVPRASIENVSVVQSEAEVEEPPPNLANEFNSNEIVRDSGLMKHGCTLFSCLKILSKIKYWKYGLNITVFGSWVDKFPFKILPRLSKISRVATDPNQNLHEFNAVRFLRAQFMEKKLLLFPLGTMDDNK
jgi:hypothetical protein